METTHDTPKGEFLLYQTEDGRARIECRFEGETVWLTQAMLAELFQTTPQNIPQHLRETCAEGNSRPRRVPPGPSGLLSIFPLRVNRLGGRS